MTTVAAPPTPEIGVNRPELMLDLAGEMSHRIVIIGGGFGGLAAAKALRREQQATVTLIDRNNFHLFQPLLYQVATGALSPSNIAAPLRAVLRRQVNTTVLLGNVVDFDLEARQVLLESGQKIAFDTLLVATGVQYNYFGHNEWEPIAPGLKRVEDAVEIRRRIFYAFEAAERETDPERRREWLTFVIVGGGPTGVEMAGALSEIAHHTLRYDFRHIDPGDAHIILVDGSPRVLSNFPEDLSASALKSLQRMEVEVRLDVMARQIDPESVVVRDDHGQETIIRSRTVIWAAGVRTTPIAAKLAAAAGVATDRMGRLPVQPDLTLANYPNVIVIGDMAAFPTEDGRGLPGVAPVAIQQGQFVAKLIRDRLRARQSVATTQKPTDPAGDQPAPRFQYVDKGNMATIGRASAVADIRGWHFTGYIAWLLWLFVHLMFLVQYHNRMLVLFQWAWNYITWDRSSRLITQTGFDDVVATRAEHRESVKQAHV